GRDEVEEEVSESAETKIEKRVLAHRAPAQIYIPALEAKQAARVHIDRAGITDVVSVHEKFRCANKIAKIQCNGANAGDAGEEAEPAAIDDAPIISYRRVVKGIRAMGQTDVRRIGREIESGAAIQD